MVNPAKATIMPIVVSPYNTKEMEPCEKYNTENKALGILTSDRVHLNEAGNVFLAEVMWDILKDIK